MFTGVETVHSMYVMHVLYQGVRSNIVHSKPIHEKTGTRRNALICRPHSLLELPDLRDSSKLCGLQIGIVEVVSLKDCIIFFRGQVVYQFTLFRHI